jgi:hypothetical protein
VTAQCGCLDVAVVKHNDQIIDPAEHELHNQLSRAGMVTDGLWHLRASEQEGCAAYRIMARIRS